MSAKIKLCGLFRPEDIACANQIKPDYVGFVFAESRRQVTRQKAGMLRRELEPDIRAVGVFVNEPLSEILTCLEEGVIDMAQLHGEETEEDIRKLKALSGKPVIRAIKVRTPSDIDAWLDSSADYLLFDSGAGTGRIFDWSMLAGVRRDYFLAGGLHPGNLRDAIDGLHPFAVDLSTGVETEGVKDPEKMRLAVKMARMPRKMCPEAGAASEHGI